MHLTDLAITHFRCLNQVQLKPSSSINLILGANGAGKTSILESVFCLSRGRSFRANSLNKLIQDQQSSFIVRGKLESDITHQLALQVSREGSGSNYLAKIDGEAAKSLADLSRLLPSIIIDPSIHQLIEDGPKLRRQYLDWGVFHVEPHFMTEWRRFQRALKQRNAGLKKGIPPQQLQAWTDILIESGLFIDSARKLYLEDLLQNIGVLAQSLLGVDIKLSYRSGWAKDISFMEALDKSHEREQKTGLTVVGPHRADMIIQVGDLVLNPEDQENKDTDDQADNSSTSQFHRAQQRVSRGQQKLIAASLMLAQAMHFRDKHQVSPILLIDDPFAELDSEHSKRLLQEIQSLNAQTFVTALHPIDHPIFENATKFHVEHGQVSEI